MLFCGIARQADSGGKRTGAPLDPPVPGIAPGDDGGCAKGLTTKDTKGHQWSELKDFKGTERGENSLVKGGLAQKV